MADEQKPDKAMAGMLKRKSVWPLASSGEACPDAATLAAYFDYSLTAAEISHWELHFSACARCQEQLAALARSEPASAAMPAGEKKPAISWLWDWRWLAPIGAAAVVMFVFFISYRTMYAPTGSRGGSELMAKREATSPAQAVAEPAKPAVPTPGKSDAAADAVAETKSLSVRQQEKTRSEADERQRMNAAAALESARVAQAPKDENKGKLVAEGASSGIAGRAMAKPAEEQKQVAEAENRDVIAQRQLPAAMPAQAPKPQDQITPQAGALGGQKQDRAIVAADAKEPAATVPSTVKAQEQAARKKESTAGREDAAGARFALEARRPSASKLHAAPGELFVAVPNSDVLWRFGSAGRIERSRDAGKTWETQKSPAQESFLSGSAPSESICWVGGTNGVLLRTTDGGENWERIPAPTKSDIISVKASDPLNVTLIGADGRTYQTRDAGTHWRSR